jgi:Holliday junction DNA helicase RuvA
MFYYLKGQLAYLSGSTCVIDCGGVGYKLTVSLITSDYLSPKKGQDVKIYTYLAVRENEVELYGFGSDEERASFNLLTTVSGVGPKAAMSILSVMTPDRLALAICTEDTKAIAKAPGLGAKTAARIIVDLKDKVSKDMMTASPKSVTSTASPATFEAGGVLTEATEALTVLGYDKNSILNALRGVDVKNMDVGEVIKAALKKLAR